MVACRAAIQLLWTLCTLIVLADYVPILLGALPEPLRTYVKPIALAVLLIAYAWKFSRTK